MPFTVDLLHNSDKQGDKSPCQGAKDTYKRLQPLAATENKGYVTGLISRRFLCFLLICGSFFLLCLLEISIEYDMLDGHNVFTFDRESDAVKFLENPTVFSVDSLQISVVGRDNRVTNNPNTATAAIIIKGKKRVRLYKIMLVSAQQELPMSEHGFIDRVTTEIEQTIQPAKVVSVSLSENIRNRFVTVPR